LLALASAQTSAAADTSTVVVTPNALKTLLTVAPYLADASAGPTQYAGMAMVLAEEKTHSSSLLVICEESSAVLPLQTLLRDTSPAG
jgi:hypothetical protein